MSYSVSLDFNRPSAERIWGFTLDGFLTRIDNVFVLEEEGPDPFNPDNTILFRKNGGVATVAGASVELRANFNYMVEFQAGMTLQSSLYDEPVSWSASIDGSTRFLRSPDAYGFYLVDVSVFDPVRLSFSGVLTGPMAVPHFAGAPGIENDRLVRSPFFHEANVRLSWRFASVSRGDGIELYAGIRNVFNAYQRDFDTGPYRDSNYIYGPARPRTMFAGIKVGY
jgi:outer membrane receptor for ferrienterochelin and colicins